MNRNPLLLFARDTVLSVGLIFLVVGCSKASAPVTNVPVPASTQKSTDLCQVSSVNEQMVEIRRSEDEKIALEKTAKSSPDKENFRRLYTAEIEFGRAAEDKLSRLTACPSGVDPAALTELKKKITTSQANVTYLRESFPEFK